MTMYHSGNDDSEATLAYIPQALSYHFSRDSATNTALTCRDSQYGYMVSTSAKTGKTDICRVDTQAKIASIDIRVMLPDLVWFPSRCGSKPVKIRSWLNDVGGKTRATFTDRGKRAIASMQTTLGSCMWISDQSYRLALVEEVTDRNEPIAYILHPEARSTPILVVDIRAAGIVDEIVVASIILEQKLRLKEQSEWMALESGDGYQYALCALALG
ncbi:hypothetical protein CCMSSC00406_0001059 [Pleurotus cornucopiae]|uniref:Uncharacterized protein n=1 Tax=Pleurotus cornucopiae TaxID=5321 RepID=A0ACB7IKT3_PLECO|nr:hypothetical protein CCMSSC00406_0001059 [Pleurotus cornucopiae]